MNSTLSSGMEFIFILYFHSEADSSSSRLLYLPFLRGLSQPPPGQGGCMAASVGQGALGWS